MAATRSEIAQWFDEAPVGSSHMVVWCDTFDWTDYPEYLRMTSEDARKHVNFYSKRPYMKLMEVYDLKQDKNIQLYDHLVINF